MGDLTDFQQGMIDGARRAGLSISQTVKTLGFSHTAVAEVYSRCSDTGDGSSRRAREAEYGGDRTVQEITSPHRRGYTSRQDLKEKKEKEVVEEKEKEKTENGSGDAPANGTEENGAKHKEKNAEDPEEEEDEGEGEGEGEEEEEEEEGEETESDGHPVKRPAEDEEKSETKKQKTENGDSTEVKESA
ncbi:prothymosin alpha-B-like isoform X1 [Hyperolius riggenbachi]|uniref:prothymosin alpha-B-like isoform X1 n=1 Tax=Hyperolius riggenbachi TaxID=752182 RepID=UPI0035A37ED2